jgi:tight adherence protein C
MVFFLLLALIAGTGAVFVLSYEWFHTRERARAQEEARQRLGIFDTQAFADDAEDTPADFQIEGSARGAMGKRTDKGMAAFLSRTPLGVLSQKRREERRRVSFERDLPALLEVVALGMQAGMGFDQAFGLYTERFATPLARCCRESLKVWQKGLRSRDEGMRQLADRVGTSSFQHFSSSVLRALRFGAPMTQLLLDLAREARKEYCAKRQELVAKAPVKMLLPTGALILPAMLLLVMGPIVLDLMRKMG